MVLGLGMDLVEVGRIAKAMAKFGDHFLNRCFAPSELARPRDPEHVAGLFAAKEAALKALGTGWGSGVGFRHVHITHTPQGQPQMVFSGPAQAHMLELGASQVRLSITHTRELAAAVVVLCRD